MDIQALLTLPFLFLGGAIVIFYLFVERTAKHSIPIFILMVIWAFAVYAEYDMIDFQYLSTIFIGSAAFLYLNRFKDYNQKRTIDWLKICLVMLVVVVDAVDNELVFTSLAFTLVATYVLDKTAIKSEITNKWKAILLIPFLLSVGTEIGLKGIMWEEQKELHERIIDSDQELIRSQQDLERCKADKQEIESDLRKIKAPTN